MRIQARSVDELPGQTGGTVECLRGKVVRAIERHASLLPEPPQAREPLLRAHAGKDLEKSGITCARDNGGKEVPEVMVTRDLMGPQPRLRIVAALCGL